MYKNVLAFGSLCHTLILFVLKHLLFQFIVVSLLKSSDGPLAQCIKKPIAPLAKISINLAPLTELNKATYNVNCKDFVLNLAI